MSEAAAWLQARMADAPESLRARMIEAVQETPTHAGVEDVLANAALRCLRKSLQEPANRESALDLLAADALLTHACEAAAQNGLEALLSFTKTWDTTRFQELLEA